MYHSVKFGSYNTFNKWHLVPDGRPVISQPEPIVSHVDVPGSSGGLDLTEALTGYTTYGNRTGSLLFHVLNGYGEWQNIYQDIANKLHGRRMKLILDDDPDWYYMGRYTVSWTSNNDGTWSDVEIGYTLDPYKYYKSEITFSGTVSGNEAWEYPNYEFLFRDDISQPVIPHVTINQINTKSIYFSVKNPEIGLTYGKSKSDEYSVPITNEPLYSCVLSNISGSNNNLTVKADCDTAGGSASFTMKFRRAVL